MVAAIQSAWVKQESRTPAPGLHRIGEVMPSLLARYRLDVAPEPVRSPTHSGPTPATDNGQ